MTGVAVEKRSAILFLDQIEDETLSGFRGRVGQLDLDGYAVRNILLLPPDKQLRCGYISATLHGVTQNEPITLLFHGGNGHNEDACFAECVVRRGARMNVRVNRVNMRDLEQGL